MADYLRIPVLEGVPQHRTEYATVRADLRRHDADANSSEPYYPGLSAAVAVALQLQINGTPLQISTFASNSYAATIAAINAVLGSAGTAFDSDGCLSIRSSVRGSAGSVRIVGGTAATILGFDVSLNKYYATGGEIPSSAEGRAGQPFGTVFPNGKEDLTTEAVRRSLAKISTNTDILYSNQKKPVATLKNIGQISVASNYTGSGPYALPAGAPKIYSKSGKTHLYVVLVDSVLQKPISIKVTGLLNNGTPADGVNQVTRASQQILGIYNGRIVKVANTSGVSVGDYANIVGATNFNPWNNNGAKWVVEEVVDSTTVSLRPMSKSEAALYGHEPGTALNSKKSGAEVYGSITFTSGQFCTATHLATSMALPPGSLLDVYATVRADVDSSVADVSHLSVAADALNRPSLIGANGLPLNCVLSQPTGSVASSTLTYSDFYVSWEGVVQRVPSGSVAISSSYNGSAVCASWSPSTGKVVIATSFLGSLGNLPLMYIPSSRTGIVGTARIGAAYNDPIITVGTFPSRQVPSLDAALYIKKYDPSIFRIEIYNGSQLLTEQWVGQDITGLEIVAYGAGTTAITTVGGSIPFVPSSNFTLRNVNSNTTSIGGLVAVVPGTKLYNIGVTTTTGYRALFGDGAFQILENNLNCYINIGNTRTLNLATDSSSILIGNPSAGPNGALIQLGGRLQSNYATISGSFTDTEGTWGLYVASSGIRATGKILATGSTISCGMMGNSITSGARYGASIGYGNNGVVNHGQLVLERSGEATPAILTKMGLDTINNVLMGGSTVLADDLHTHKAIAAEFTIGESDTTASVNVTTTNLNTLTAGSASNADALHTHDAETITATPYDIVLSSSTVQGQLKDLVDYILYNNFATWAASPIASQVTANLPVPSGSFSNVHFVAGSNVGDTGTMFVTGSTAGTDLFNSPDDFSFLFYRTTVGGNWLYKSYTWANFSSLWTWTNPSDAGVGGGATWNGFNTAVILGTTTYSGKFYAVVSLTRGWTIPLVSSGAVSKHLLVSSLSLDGPWSLEHDVTDTGSYPPTKANFEVIWGNLWANLEGEFYTGSVVSSYGGKSYVLIGATWYYSGYGTNGLRSVIPFNNGKLFIGEPINSTLNAFESINGGQTKNAISTPSGLTNVSRLVYRKRTNDALVWSMASRSISKMTESYTISSLGSLPAGPSFPHRVYNVGSFTYSIHRNGANVEIWRFYGDTPADAVKVSEFVASVDGSTGFGSSDVLRISSCVGRSGIGVFAAVGQNISLRGIESRPLPW